jgi:hypothetical protein
MQGTDVSELQRDLVWLGFNSMSQEITASHFGETTRSAVQKLQKQNSIEPNGVLEIMTVAIINEGRKGVGSHFIVHHRHRSMKKRECDPFS